MKAKKWQYGSIGTVSHGTMRAEDLIPAFTSELRWLGHRDRELTRIERAMVKRGYYESEESIYDLDTLFDMLDSHSLPYFYFGSHPGDGSDYGFWLSESICEGEFDGLTVNDTSEVPDKYTGEVLHVNDHGNMTLYVARRGKLTEIWGVV